MDGDGTGIRKKQSQSGGARKEFAGAKADENFFQTKARILTVTELK